MEKLKLEVVSLEKIDKNPNNSSIFEETEIEHLAEVIKKEGFTTPISVYRKTDGRYEIVSGHRRYEAMKLLGEKNIPCIVSNMPVETEKNEILINSNMATRKLCPLDWARAIDFYKKNLKAKGFTGDLRTQVAKDFKISESNVYRYECILKLIPELQEFCKQPNFPYSSLRQASSLSKEDQEKIYKEILKMEAVEKRIAEDEVDKSEIVFTRTKIEQIINNIIHQNERNAWVPGVTATKEDEIPTLEDMAENSEIEQFVKQEDPKEEEIVVLENNYFDQYISNDCEEGQVDESTPINENLFRGIKEVIGTLKGYQHINLKKSEKEELKKYIEEVDKIIKHLKENL